MTLASDQSRQATNQTAAMAKALPGCVETIADGVQWRRRCDRRGRLLRRGSGLLAGFRIMSSGQCEAAANAGRSVPNETVADFRRLGILRVMQPRRFGGHQASFDIFSRIVETLAEGCAASAWVYAVLAEHQWIIACMPDQA